MSTRTYESIKYTFTQDEIRELGEQLAREAQVVFDLQAGKSAVAAEFSGKIKAANKRVAELSEKVNNGYELREVECMAMLEDPRPGMKRIIRIDTNETIRVEAMSVKEMQGSFGFGEEKS